MSLLLKRLREEHGWSRTELGFQSHTHPNRVGAIENGRVIPGDSSVELVRLAEALGYDGLPSDLVKEPQDYKGAGQ